MDLFYNCDHRNDNPNRYEHFKVGWNRFVREDHMTSKVLDDRLTWENLRYRMAAIKNAAFTSDDNNDLVKQAYALSVAIQKASLSLRRAKSPGNLTKQDREQHQPNPTLTRSKYPSGSNLTSLLFPGGSQYPATAWIAILAVVFLASFQNRYDGSCQRMIVYRKLA